MSDITVINDSEQSSLVTNGLAKNGELYLKAAGSTDAGAIVVYDSGSWRTFANEVSSFSNAYSVDFDGANDYIYTSGFTLGAAYSFSMWFKLNSGPNYYTLLNSEHYYTVGYDNFVYRISNASTIQLYSYSGTSSAQSISITVPTLSTGTWYNLVLTNSGSGSAQGYLNGNSVTTSGSTSRAFTDLQNTKGLIIGDNLTNNNRAFDGNIDEVSIFDSALSETDISTLRGGASAGTLGVPADISSLNPVGWWRMGDNDGGTGTTITDQGSGGNDGTLTNGPTFSSSVPS